jgi:hypothetical protein
MMDFVGYQVFFGSAKCFWVKSLKKDTETHRHKFEFCIGGKIENIFFFWGDGIAKSHR